MDYLKNEDYLDKKSDSEVESKNIPVAPPSPAKEDVNGLNPPKPTWMSDEDYNEASLYFSPDRINQIYKGFDPASADPLYQNLYKSTFQKPQIPEERRIKASNTIAGLTDALSLIVQGATGLSGGNIPRQETSALKTNDGHAQRLRDIYKAERDRYNAGLYQSTLRDIESSRQDYNRDRSGLLGVIQNIRRLKNAKDIARSRNETEMNKFKVQQKAKELALEETQRHNKAMEGVALKNAASNAIRASRSGSSSKKLKNGDLEFFDANTATAYTVNEKKFKANAPQMFKLLKEEIFANDDNLRRRYGSSKGKLSLQEQEDAVKKYMYDNPEAMKFLEKISKSVNQDKSLVDNRESTSIDSDSGIPPIVKTLLEQSRPEYIGPFRPQEAKAENKENGTKKIGW